MARKTRKTGTLFSVNLIKRWALINTPKPWRTKTWQRCISMTTKNLIWLFCTQFSLPFFPSYEKIKPLRIFFPIMFSLLLGDYLFSVWCRNYFILRLDQKWQTKPEFVLETNPFEILCSWMFEYVGRYYKI